MSSEAFDIVEAAEKPCHADGGPCAGCAFRRGSEANQTDYTTLLAQLCVEGLRPFYCHEHPGLCRGFVAAVNLRGVPQTEDERRHTDAAAFASDILGECIERAKQADLGAS